MSHSSPWFLVACASAIVHRNHFRFHQKDECSESKVKFRQISNCYKIALERAKMAYANKIFHNFPEIWLSELLANG